MIKDIIIKLECNDALEGNVAAANLQKLTDRLKGKGINNLIKMYNDPIKKIAVNAFFMANGI